MAEAQPVLGGTPEQQKLAATMLGLMQMQGRAYAADAPIRQSLKNFVSFFLEQGLRSSAESVAEVIEATARANPAVFFRQEADGEVYFVTSRRGAAVRPTQAPPTRYMPPAAATSHPALAAPAERAGRPVVITRATLMTPGASGSVTMRPLGGDATILRGGSKPTIIRREEPSAVKLSEAGGEAPLPSDEIEVVEAPEQAQPVFVPQPEPVIEPEIRFEAVVKRPKIVTPDGQSIIVDGSAEEIYERGRTYFRGLVSEAMTGDPRFVSFGEEWMLEEMLTNFTKADLRRIHSTIEESGDVLPDSSILADVFGKNPEGEDYERVRFSLNLALFREKRVFDFRGTNHERQWGLVGMASPRPARTTLRGSEIGQDFKFLEDEAPRTDEGAGRWIHTLTFYEIENGLLPYSATAKLILPRPLLKEQRVALLEFHAPQFNVSVQGELHYPSGNRGGWVEGLEEILDHFVPGARVVVEGTERDNQFLLTYRKAEAVEIETVRYDDKKRRFVFSPITVEFQLDESMAVSRSRFKSLGNALRLEENSRRKGDQVISFAFSKAGVKETEDEKTVYRAHVSELLPVVNLEKPFSRASLVRFMTTHPHYKKDEAEEGYYFFKPED